MIHIIIYIRVRALSGGAPCHSQSFLDSRMADAVCIFRDEQVWFVPGSFSFDDAAR